MSLPGGRGGLPAHRGGHPADGQHDDPIRVLIAEDHPAVAMGLHAVLGDRDDLVAVGVALSRYEIWPLLKETLPDVVLLDYHLSEADGLEVCRRIRSMALPPAVLIYTAFANETLSAAATESGAAGLVSKGVPTRDLFEAIRTAARTRSAREEQGPRAGRRPRRDPS
jgi:DNA-binding NarL/FixJ family response regulator